MKKMLQLMFKDRHAKIILTCFFVLSLAVGFLIMLTNDLLARLFHDYLLLLEFDGFVLLLSIVIGLFILSFGMKILGTNLSSRVQYTGVTRLTEYYIQRLLGAKSSFFKGQSSPELYTKLSESTFGIGFLVQSGLSILSHGILFVFYAIIIFRIDMVAGLLSLATVPLYFVLNGWAGERLSEFMHKQIEAEGDMSTVTQEAFQQVSNVKAKGAHNFFTRRCVKVLNRIKQISVSEQTLESYIEGSTNLLRYIAPPLVIFGALMLSPSFDGGATYLILLYINIPLFLVHFAYMFEQFIEYQASKPFIAQLREFDQIELEDEEGVEIRTFTSLRTKKVKVVYEVGREIEVPSFEMKAGEKVMLFGESGIGKSTLFNILMGLVTDYEGDILINDRNLRDIRLSSIRKVFGIGWQHHDVLTLNFRENVALGRELDDEHLDDLLKITALKTQYIEKGHAVLSNKVMSGGEKSRMGLIQALVNSPDILLLDEVFSNVDEALEANILKDLFQVDKKRTVLCVSHRNSSKVLFDRVVEFA